MWLDKGPTPPYPPVFHHSNKANWSEFPGNAIHTNILVITSDPKLGLWLCQRGLTDNIHLCDYIFKFSMTLFIFEQVNPEKHVMVITKATVLS